MGHWYVLLIIFIILSVIQRFFFHLKLTCCGTGLFCGDLTCCIILHQGSRGFWFLGSVYEVIGFKSQGNFKYHILLRLAPKPQWLGLNICLCLYSSLCKFKVGKKKGSLVFMM